MPQASTSAFRRILAVKLADLGDLLTITPALQALRAAHPSAQIDLLAPPSSTDVLKGASYLDNVIAFDKFALDSPMGLLKLNRLASSGRFLLRLRRSGYDAVALFHHFTTRWGSLKQAILAYSTGAHIRAGLDNGRGLFLTHRVEDRGFGAMHEADYWLYVAALIGADAQAGWRPHIPVNDMDRQVVTALLEKWGMKRARPLIAIHPGAGWYSLARIWPAERFALVGRALIERYSARIVILGGPDEEERAASLEGLLNEEKQVLNLAGKTTIHQTAALLERCDLFIGNDSGPMHLAAAVGAPVVAIFGPSNSRAWGPYTPPGEPIRHKVVSRDLPCVPCFYRKHSLGLREGCGPRPCLTGLPAEWVLDACEGVLGVGGRGSEVRG